MTLRRGVELLLCIAVYAAIVAYYYRGRIAGSGISWWLERTGCKVQEIDQVTFSGASLSIRSASATCPIGTLSAKIVTSNFSARTRGEGWDKFDVTADSFWVFAEPSGKSSPPGSAHIGELVFNLPSLPDIKINIPSFSMSVNDVQDSFSFDAAIEADTAALTLSARKVRSMFGAMAIENGAAAIAAMRKDGAIQSWNLTVSIPQLEVGQSIRDLSAKAAVTRSGDGVAGTFSELRFTSADAAFAAPGSRIEIPTGNFKGHATVTAVSIEKIMSLYPQTAVIASGILDGEATFEIEWPKIAIESSRFTARPPGGVIMIPLPEGNAELTTAQKALRDLRYESLVAEGTSTASGDLALDISVTGMSPVIGEDRPVQLNLAVSENLPALLRTTRLFQELQEIGRK